MRREYIDSMSNLSATWLSRLCHQRQAWLDALPSQCAICHRWPGPRICKDCSLRWAAPTHRCHTCAMPLPAAAPICGACLQHPAHLQRCIAVLDYAYPWQEIIGRYKFQSDLGLVRSLGRLLANHAEVQQLLHSSDAVLPVPASAERIRERGFDHTALLVRSLLSQTDCALPLLTHAVQRQHLAQSQHASARAQRLRQLRGVFSIAPAKQSAVAGRRLVLLDDVMTTGATLNALADCLLHAGAASVSAVVLARTP